MELRDLFIAEQQWDLSFEPDNTWSPDRWRKIEVGITAGCFPVYLILIILWFPYRFFLLPLFLLTYPFRLFYLLDAEYTRILYSSWQLIGAAYRGILQLVIPPINPLAGYLYPHLRRRWELFNTYYWAHWWDQFVYEPSYEFLIKTEIRMDFLDGEWLPEEQEEDGWWLRMVRNRRYRFPAYRFLLSRLYWTPFQLPPLFLLTYPFGLFYQIFLYPFLLAPLRLVLAHLSHQSRILALANSPVSALFSSPGTFFLALPPLQRHWAPRQESFDLFIRTSRVDLKRWIWDRLLPGWFLHCSPRIQLFRSIVFPWSLVPLAFILLLTPLAPLLSSKFLYRPLGGDFLLIIILGTLFLQLAPPLRRWSYWDFRYLLPLSMVVVMFFQTGLWPPRLWGPKYWGFQFLFFLCSGPIPWLLAFVKPLLLLPLTVPLFFYDLLAVPLPLFLADLSLLVQSLLRLVGWWLYHPWGWLLEILWNHVIWPPIATPWYHLDLWYYYSLKPLLFLLFRWIRWFAALGFWLICQLLVLPLRAYWQFPDLGWVQPTPWLHHILLDGWCPFPRLTDPSPPSPPFWGPRWVKPPILTNPRLLPSFPWPPPL